MLTSIRKSLRPFKQTIGDFIRPTYFRLKYGQLAFYLNHAGNIPGFSSPEEAVALLEAARSLPKNAVIAEIGSFLGASAVVMAGARKSVGSGFVCCIDPFDGSGDEFSVPHYQEIQNESKLPLRQRFDNHIKQANLKKWVKVFPGFGQTVGREWEMPLDMLYLDGDQSPAGARETYEIWHPFLKKGGILALHNSSDVNYSPGHDGHRRIVVETLHAPHYTNIYCIDSITFATKNF